MGEQNSVPSAALSKQQCLVAIGFHGTFKKKLLIGFYLVNMSGNVKIH